MPTPKDKSYIRAAVDKDFAAEVAEHCQKNDITISQLIRKAVREYLERQNQKN